MSGLGQFSLRWNNFHANLSTGFHDLLKEEQLVDVTLATEGKLIKAHQVVLSVCSPFFRKIFQLNPCQHPVVILNISYRELRDILTFIYQGEVNVQQENLSGFLKAAELLQIKGLAGDDNDDTSESVEEHISKKSEQKLEQENKPKSLYQNISEYMNSDDDIQKSPSFKRIPFTSKPTSNSFTTSNSKKKRAVAPNANFIENNYLFKPSKLSHPQENLSTNSTSEQNLQCRNPHDSSRIEDIPTTISDIYSDSDRETSRFNSQHVDHTGEDTSDETENIQIKTERDDYDETNSISNNVSGMESFSNFDKENGLYYSLDNVRDPIYYPCLLCHKKFVNRYNLKIHVRDKHTPEQDSLTCDLCGKAMRNQSCLRVHRYNHRKQSQTSNY